MDKQTVYSIVKASGVVPGELVLVHFWGDDRDRALKSDYHTVSHILSLPDSDIHILIQYPVQSPLHEYNYHLG